MACLKIKAIKVLGFRVGGFGVRFGFRLYACFYFLRL